MFPSMMPFDELDQSEILRIQRLRQGKATVQQQIDDGSLMPHEGEQLMSLINTGLVPLMQRQAAVAEGKKQYQMRELDDLAARTTARQQLDAQYRAQNIEKRIAVVNDPSDPNRVAHMFEESPNKWAQIEWPQMAIDENAPDWQPLSGRNEDAFDGRPGIAPHAQGQPQYFPFGMGPGAIFADGGAPPPYKEAPPGSVVQAQAREFPLPANPDLAGAPRVGDEVRAAAGLPPAAVGEMAQGQPAADGVLGTPEEAAAATAAAEASRGTRYNEIVNRFRTWERDNPGKSAAERQRAMNEMAIAYDRETGASSAARQRMGLTAPATRRVVDYRPGENYGQLVDEPILSRDEQLRRDWGGTPPPALTREEYERAHPSAQRVPGTVPVPRMEDLMSEWTQRPVSERVAAEMDTWSRRNPNASQAQRAHMEAVVYAAYQQSHHAAEIAARQNINTALNHNRQMAGEANRQTNRETMATLRGNIRYNRSVLNAHQVGQITADVHKDMVGEATRPRGTAGEGWTPPSWASGGRGSRAWRDELEHRQLERLSFIPGALDQAGLDRLQELRGGEARQEDIRRPGGAVRAWDRMMGSDPLDFSTQQGAPNPQTNQPAAPPQDLRSINRERWTPVQQQSDASFNTMLQNPRISGSERYSNAVRALRSEFMRYGSLEAMPADVRADHLRRAGIIEAIISRPARRRGPVRDPGTFVGGVG